MYELYPYNIEEKLGFDKIRTLLIGRCRSSLGIKEVDKMRFTTNYETVKTLLLQTSEMKAILELSLELPEIFFNDLSEWLPKLNAEGSYAQVEEIAALRNSLHSFKSSKAFFMKKEEENEDIFKYPALARLISNIELFPELIDNINRIIDNKDNIKDNASPQLLEIRGELSKMNSSISNTIHKIFSKGVKEGVLDKDAAPTIRNGRLVIPVRSGNKRSIAGIIHDESSTGQTVYIEPSAVVALVNKQRELEMEEQREIVRILIQLCDTIRPEIALIIRSNKILGILDFIMAKASFAMDMNAQMPHLSKKPEIEIYGGFHPVLYETLKKNERNIVKTDITLDSSHKILIISGPNAGGKSVTLKTVGILQYMTQCGILPCLYSNSHIGIFHKLFIDIGDEQSLENDLSTYSSHLKNMRYFLLHADKRTLIMIDEIGSGTEPNIGSALAQSILSNLHKTGCYGIITTHYHNLKRFAETTQGFINGAMLYDRSKLEPTFQLAIGNPGSSFALEIAGKIGLPKNIIDEAKDLVGVEYVDSDRFLMEIARDKKYWQNKRTNIKVREDKLERLETKYEEGIEELRKERKAILSEARAKAQEIIQGANKLIENTISDIKKANAEKEETKRLRESINQYKENILKENTEGEKEISRKIKGPKIKKDKVKTNNVGSKEKLSLRPLVVGDYVKMAGSSTAGKILSISGKEAEVAFGNLRTQVKLNKLTLTQAPASSGKSNPIIINSVSGDVTRAQQLNFNPELDIRGFRANEALDAVIRYIDLSIQYKIDKVRILHGTGNGILRELVRQQLAATGGVKSYSDEDVRMGGSGITVVSLR